MTRSRKAAGFYALLMGCGMLGWWSLALLTDQMPELHTTPVAAVLHLAAEFATAFALLLGGYSLLKCRRWAATIHPLSLGMLLYTAVASAGFYGQRGDIAYVSMFAAIVIGTLGFTGLALGRRSQREQGAGRSLPERPLPPATASTGDALVP